MYKKKYFNFSFQPDTPLYVLDGVRVDFNSECLGMRIEHGFLRNEMPLIVLKQYQTAQTCRNFQILPYLINNHYHKISLCSKNMGLNPYLKITFQHKATEIIFEQENASSLSFIVANEYDTYKIDICIRGSGSMVLKNLVIEDQSVNGFLLENDIELCKDVWLKEENKKTYSKKGLITFYEWQEDATPEYELSFSDISIYQAHISSPNYFEHYFQKKAQVKNIFKWIKHKISDEHVDELYIYGRGTTAVSVTKIGALLCEFVPVKLFLENPIFNLASYLLENPFEARFRGYKKNFSDEPFDLTNKNLEIVLYEEKRSDSAILIEEDKLKRSVIQPLFMSSEHKGKIRKEIQKEVCKEKLVKTDGLLDNKN